MTAFSLSRIANMTFGVRWGKGFTSDEGGGGVVEVDALSDNIPLGSSDGFMFTADSWVSGGTNLIASGISGNKVMTITRIAGRIGTEDPGTSVDADSLEFDLTGSLLVASPAELNSVTGYAFTTEVAAVMETLTGSAFDNYENYYYVEGSIADVGTFTAIVFYKSGL